MVDLYLILDKYDIKEGAQCADSYKPLDSNWQDCKEAAEYLGFPAIDLDQIEEGADSKDTFGRSRPKGCFRSKDNGKFRFNAGDGGRFQGDDAILCLGISHYSRRLISRTHHSSTSFLLYSYKNGIDKL